MKSTVWLDTLAVTDSMIAHGVTVSNCCLLGLGEALVERPSFLADYKSRPVMVE